MNLFTYKTFSYHQINQILVERWSTLRRKLISIPLIILAIFLVIIIRLLRPFLIIRIDAVDVGRIGGPYHVNYYYLNEKAAGQHRVRYFDLFYFIESTNHVNRQWEKMWKRVLPVFPWPKLARFVERINNWFSGQEVHQIPKFDVIPTKKEHVSYLEGRNLKVYSKYNQRLECTFGSSQSNLSFTEAEEARGEKEIQQLGIPLDSPFICFHNRDSVFLDAALDNFDWKYHNYRDSSIQNYLNAAEEMARRGCYAVRLGAKVKDKVKSVNPKVIKYACNGMRSDFLDIYLSAKCRFILCSDTGISLPAEVFKRPLVFVNWTMPLRVPVYIDHCLVIFKKFYLKNENRFMTFSEIMNLEFGGRDTNRIFTSLNLELIENTPEEISAVTIEMDERINGTWNIIEEDVKLQQRFWDLFGPAKLKSPDFWIGAEYLRDNQELLK